MKTGEALPDEARQLDWRTADRERRRGLGGGHRTPDKRRMEGLGDDGEIGQFGHGGDCSREKPCARLSRLRKRHS